MKAQEKLPDNIQLVLTRGYQSKSWMLKIMRRAGALAFALLYSDRKTEIPEIFGHNGHATDGNHIDVSIRLNDQTLKLLPKSVFTSIATAENIMAMYSPVISKVKTALQECGFKIH